MKPSKCICGDNFPTIQPILGLTSPTVFLGWVCGCSFCSLGSLARPHLSADEAVALWNELIKNELSSRHSQVQ